MIERPFYTNKILSYLDTPFVKILTGVHRCGKSTIMKMLMNELQNCGIENNVFCIIILILWSMRILKQAKHYIPN